MSDSARPAVAWTLSGVDPSGMAGVQADLRAFSAFGVHAASVVTALTAQGERGVAQVAAVDPGLVEAQIESLRQGDLGPAAIKIGIVGDVRGVQVLARAIDDLHVPVVLDPVLQASSGEHLVGSRAWSALRTELLGRATLVTPNLPEAAALAELPGHAVEDMPELAARLLELGAQHVLIKGGHVEGGDLVHDYYLDRSGGWWLTTPRRDARCRGTGCALASAVAANLALGEDLLSAVVAARAFLASALRAASGATGWRSRLVAGAAWRAVSEDFPWASRSFAAATHRPAFAAVDRREIAFYPIVDRATMVARMVEAGARSVQLRIKDLGGAALEREVEAAIRMCRERGARHYVNDHWRLAIRLDAYGVHLGQEDLVEADVGAIARAGLRLGVSTHSYFEAAVAHGVAPSYVALGPIFPTTCKAMRFGPQGMARLTEWRDMLPYPLVAIGGLRIDDAAAAYDAGADGIAMISDVTLAADPEARAREWIRIADRATSRLSYREV